MKEYNKLVRDRIPEIMINKGCKPVIRILNDEDYLNELNKKILEEVNEYLESGEVEELADVCEVLYAILNLKNVSLDEFHKIRLEKSEKRGAFNNKIFLERED